MTADKQRKFNIDMLGFLLTYGGLTQQALNVYIEYMREQARITGKLYAAIKDDPERCAFQDATLITTQGLKSRAELFEQIAAQAQRARNQLTALSTFAEEL